MPPSPGLPTRGAALLLALCAGLLLLRLGAVPLLGPDEPRYVRVAVEMQRAGEWVRPTLQARPWLEKPPLYYWLAGAGFARLGETEVAARLPSVAAALLLAGVTALLGSRLYGGRAGLHAGFVAGTSLLTFAYGRAAAMDMLLAATVTAATGLLGLRLLGIAGGLAVPAAGALIGLAVLAKGPLGLLLPALVVGADLLLARDRVGLRRVASPAGLALFLLIGAPWYVAIWRDQGRAFLDTFLLAHNVQRFTSTIHNHPGSALYYLPVLLLGLFPWSGLILPGLAALAPRHSRTDRFVLLWLLLPLLFFSAAGSKLPGYILPCLPPLALLAGRAADRLLAREVAPGWTRAGALLGLVVGALVAAVPPFLLAREGDRAWPALLPLGAWAVVITFVFSRRVAPDPAGALAVLRVGAVGVAVLLALAAPGILARRESGRDLFLPANGREVLAWGAWRTAWMAGYFYNDGRVREVRDLDEIQRAAETGPVLVLCGPGERRRLAAMSGVRTLALAEGPRGNALIRLVWRPAPASPS